MERAVGRIENREILGLPEYIAGSAAGATIGGLAGGLPGGALGGLTSGLAVKAMRDPEVVSRLSFALNKAGKAIAKSKGGLLKKVATRIPPYLLLKGNNAQQVPDEFSTPLSEREQQWKSLGNGY